MTPPEAKAPGARAWEYARRLAFPRLVGRAGERRAAGVVREAFAALGYEVAVWPFPVVRTPWAWMRIGLTIVLALLISAGWTAPRSPLIAAACCGLLLGVLPVMEWRWRHLALQDSRQEGAVPSSNIIARRPGQRPEGMRTLYLLAHYDSKSQRFALPVRVALVAFILLGSIAFGLLNLAAGLFPAFGAMPGNAVASFVATLLWAGALVAALALLGAGADDNSPGALDNAGSVGTLLALAEAFREAPPHGVDLVFVSTGAEEAGLLGACALLRRWRSRFDRDRCRFLNLELIGAKGSLRLIEGARLLQTPGSRFARIICRAARRQAVPLRSFPLLPGFLMDHVPFGRAGFQAVSLVGLSGGIRRVHTPRDTMALVDAAALDEAARLVQEVVRALEEESQDAFSPSSP